MDMLKDFAANHLSSMIDALVYVAIAVVTLIGVIKCLLPLISTSHALRRAIRRLQQDAGNRQGTPVWQEKRFMGNRLKGSWLRFLQNAEQLDRRGLPCNVEDYINDDTVTHGPGNATLAELIPGMLTSLGILGTFMGMTAGLSGLDVSADADSLISGIQNLIKGMEFAFGTSVAGVSCSIVFNMCNRILQGSSYRAIDDFVECFTSLAMSRPLDNDVQLICQNQDSNHMLSSLTDVLPGQLAGAMEGSVTRALQPVAKAMDNFLVGATRAQVDGVGRIVSSFVQQMNGALNDQFVQLGCTMTDINQNQLATMEHVHQAIQSAGAIVTDVKQLQMVSQDVMAHFEHYVQELGDARRRDERFEQSTADLLAQLHQMTEQQTSAMNKVKAAQEALIRTMEQYTLENGKAITSMQQSAAANGRQLDHMASAMTGAGQELSASCQQFVQGVVGSLSQALGMFDANMSQLVATLTERVEGLGASGTSAATAEQTAEMQRLLAQLSHSIDNAASALTAKEG